MPQEALLNILEEDARNQSARMLEDAEAAAKEIVAESEREVLAAREERVKDLSDSLEKKKAALVNSARTRAEGLKLKARRELIDDVFSEAVKSLNGLPGDRYEEFLGRLFGELKAEWAKDRGKEKPVALVNPADMGIIKDHEIEFKPDPKIEAGVVFVSADNRLRYENTVPSRVARIRADLLPNINKMLFGDK